MNRFLGCELLESRAVMGITGGEAERNFLGRTEPLPFTITFMRTTGLRRLAGLDIGHSNKERGNVIATINQSANYMFIKKKGKKTTIKRTDRETDIPRTVKIDQTVDLIEITYGNKSLWPETNTEVTLTPLTIHSNYELENESFFCPDNVKFRLL